MKFVTASDVKKLIKKHSSPPFNERDAALISAVGMSYFNAVELSLVRVKHLIAEDGRLISCDYLPEEFSYQGNARKFFIGKKTYLREMLERYIRWRKEHGFGLINLGIYAGLDPESRFFLKDDGSPFEVNFKRRYENDKAVQALQMQRHFKKYFLGSGVTFKDLQESFLYSSWNAIVKEKGELIAVKALMKYTNLTAETIKNKCAKNGAEITATLESIFK